MASPNEKDDVPMLPISDSSRSVSLAVTSSTIDDDAKGLVRQIATSVNRYLGGIMYPGSRFAKIWTQLLAFSAVGAILMDPFFFFLVKVKYSDQCLTIDWPATTAFVAIRSGSDFLYFVNNLFEMCFWLVDNPRGLSRVALMLRFFIVLPLPQIRMLWIIPAYLGAAASNELTYFELFIIFQYGVKLYLLPSLLAGNELTGIKFKPAVSNFVRNLLTFMLAGHVVGTLWYLFAVWRIERCFHDVCDNSARACRELIVCVHGNNANIALLAWRVNASACFQEDRYQYGILTKAVNLTHHSKLSTRYSYSLFWGFQQITTLTGGLVPNYDASEVFFTIVIIGLGILLFPLLVGNMHNFFQVRGQRNSEMMPLRPLDVEQRMSHERLPEGIRKRVGLAEWVNWAATRGFNENLLFENMPSDLQRAIRRHLFLFLKKVMDKSILDAIRERLKERRYISSDTVLRCGGVVEEMVFIVRGEMESIGEDRSVLSLSEGDVCGEELLTWCLERSSVNPDGTRTRMPSKGLVSNRIVRCLTDVEAFSLSVADLEDITSLFLRFLRSHKEKGAIRSPYWRLRAARQIQVPLKHRRRRIQIF